MATPASPKRVKFAQIRPSMPHCHRPGPHPPATTQHRVTAQRRAASSISHYSNIHGDVASLVRWHVATTGRGVTGTLARILAVVHIHTRMCTCGQNVTHVRGNIVTPLYAYVCVAYRQHLVVRVLFSFCSGGPAFLRRSTPGRCGDPLSECALQRHIHAKPLFLLPYRQ